MSLYNRSRHRTGESESESCFYFFCVFIQESQRFERAVPVGDWAPEPKAHLQSRRFASQWRARVKNAAS